MPNLIHPQEAEPVSLGIKLLASGRLINRPSRRRGSRGNRWGLKAEWDAFTKAKYFVMQVKRIKALNQSFPPLQERGGGGSYAQ